MLVLNAVKINKKLQRTLKMSAQRLHNINLWKQHCIKCILFNYKFIFKHFMLFRIENLNVS